MVWHPAVDRVARALRERDKDLEGLVLGSPVLLVVLAVSTAGRLGRTLGGVLLLAAGMGLAVLVMAGVRVRPGLSYLPPGPWAGAAVVGLAVAVAAVAASAFGGGLGGGALVLASLAAGGWSAGARLAVAEEIGVFLASPGLSLVSLLLFAGLGYAVGAGLLYYLGPPVAFCLALAAHYLAYRRRELGSGRGAGPSRAAYAVAALVMALVAWLDLSR